MSVDPDSTGRIKKRPSSSEANPAMTGTSLTFRMNLLSSLLIIERSRSLSTHNRSRPSWNFGFSTSNTAGKMRAVVRLVCKEPGEKHQTFESGIAAQNGAAETTILWNQTDASATGISQQLNQPSMLQSCYPAAFHSQQE